MARFKWVAKVLLWALGITIGLVQRMWVFHSPIVKWAVKKYSPEYTGPPITLSKFQLNPLDGKLTMGGLKIMEAAGDSAFLYVDHIMLNGTLIFIDHTLEQSFRYSFADLSHTADDINSVAKEIMLRAHSGLNIDGTFDGELALDPTTMRNMRFN